jgi:DNA-directed RNA polymerase subunit RPC12/RpoP
LAGKKYKLIFDILFALGLRMMGMKPMSANEFKFYCSHCDQPLKCEPQFAGRQIQCPACQHLIRIPNPPAGTGFTQVQPESGQTWATHVPKGNKA